MNTQTQNNNNKNMNLDKKKVKLDNSRSMSSPPATNSRHQGSGAPSALNKAQSREQYLKEVRCVLGNP